MKLSTIITVDNYCSYTHHVQFHELKHYTMLKNNHTLKYELTIFELTVWYNEKNEY